MLHFAANLQKKTINKDLITHQLHCYAMWTHLRVRAMKHHLPRGVT